jgi:hypothetical protein
MNLNLKYKKLGINSSWPRKNDCYRVDVTYNDGTSFINEYMPRAEYELIVELQSIQKLIDKSKMKKLLETIENFGDEQYGRGGDDVHEQNADAGF